ILIVIIAAGVEQQIATDSAHVSQDRRRNQCRGVGYYSVIAVYYWVLDDVGQGNARANAQPGFSIAIHFVQVCKARDRNHGRGSLLAALHVRIEVRAAGDEGTGRSRVPLHQQRVAQGPWDQVIKLWQAHHSWQSNGHSRNAECGVRSAELQIRTQKLKEIGDPHSRVVLRPLQLISNLTPSTTSSSSIKTPHSALRIRDHLSQSRM